jgi:hypothetical protein
MPLWLLKFDIKAYRLSRTMLEASGGRRPVDIVGWKARYDIWNLASNAVICSVFWNLNPAVLKVLLEDALNRFPFWMS